MAPTVMISREQLPDMARQIAKVLMAALKAKAIPVINIAVIFDAIDRRADRTVLTRSRRETLADLTTREIVKLAGK